MNGKQFKIATLFAVVLLTLAFIPISSHQAGTYKTPLATQQTGTTPLPYDPWADYNGDGIIDIDDVIPAALAYGTSGEPTKNVNVTNFPLDKQGNLKVKITYNYYEWSYSTWLSPYKIWLGTNTTAGYRQVAFYISVVGTLEVTVWFNMHQFDFFTVTTTVWKTYQVLGSEITVRIQNPSGTEQRGFYYYIYVTA